MYNPFEFNQSSTHPRVLKRCHRSLVPLACMKFSNGFMIWATDRSKLHVLRAR